MVGVTTDRRPLGTGPALTAGPDPEVGIRRLPIEHADTDTANATDLTPNATEPPTRARRRLGRGGAD
jgi:hypothetical protein